MKVTCSTFKAKKTHRIWHKNLNLKKTVRKPRTDLLVRVVDDAVNKRRDGAFLGFAHVAAKMLTGGQTAGRHTDETGVTTWAAVAGVPAAVLPVSCSYLAGSL